MSKELFSAIAVDLISLFVFGVITADLNDDSIEAKVVVLSFFTMLALANVYFFFRHKKSLQKDATGK